MAVVAVEADCTVVVAAAVVDSSCFVVAVADVMSYKGEEIQRFMTHN